ncbi:MAG: hypothetical protein H6765_11395 [Candidatus Peribacteria bacterium]|nr:MAG: hypothetical protein H6765_11395 [Candidatus Peribacteria bacterium]
MMQKLLPSLQKAYRELERQQEAFAGKEFVVLLQEVLEIDLLAANRARFGMLKELQAM